MSSIYIYQLTTYVTHTHTHTYLLKKRRKKEKEGNIIHIISIGNITKITLFGWKCIAKIIELGLRISKGRKTIWQLHKWTYTLLLLLCYHIIVHLLCENPTQIKVNDCTWDDEEGNGDGGVVAADEDIESTQTISA